MTLPRAARAERQRARLTDGVAAGWYAETIRDVPRTCRCPWSGPHLGETAHYVRTGTSRECPLAIHQPSPARAEAA